MGKILLVDDEPDLLEVGSAIIEHAGYAVSTATSVCSAIQTIQESSFDALVLDVQLGNDLGFEIVEELHRLGLRIPAVFVSGWDERGLKEEALRLGARLFVKPLNPREFVPFLARLIAGEKPSYRSR